MELRKRIIVDVFLLNGWKRYVVVAALWTFLDQNERTLTVDISVERTTRRPWLRKVIMFTTS